MKGDQGRGVTIKRIMAGIVCLIPIAMLFDWSILKALKGVVVSVGIVAIIFFWYGFLVYALTGTNPLKAGKSLYKRFKSGNR